MNKYNDEIGTILVGILLGGLLGFFIDVSERTFGELLGALGLCLLFVYLYMRTAIVSYKTGVITFSQTINRDNNPRAFKWIQLICWMGSAFLLSFLVGVVLQCAFR